MLRFRLLLRLLKCEKALHNTHLHELLLCVKVADGVQRRRLHCEREQEQKMRLDLFSSDLLRVVVNSPHLAIDDVKQKKAGVQSSSTEI